MTRRFLPLLCMLLMSITAMAQSKYTVTGTIIDQASEPMIGVTITEKGTNNGTLTDVNGKFTLNVSSPEAMINLRFVGYLTVDYRADSPLWQSPVQMTEEAQNIEGVVVIGYGTTSKKDATGSVAVMKVDDVNKGVVTTPQDLLKGKVAGVVVTSNSGQPGAGASIRIRGGSSLRASNDPLIVIDGVPLDNTGISGMSDPLAALNPNDIESFSILKDASATAIYGSRASNGVIIVTTKKGKSGGVKLNYSGNVQINTVPKYNAVMGTEEYREFVKEQFGEKSMAYTGLGKENTDWQREVLRTSVSTDHNISLSGATENMPYRVSVGFTDDNGIIKRSNFQRTSVSVGLKPTFLDNHLTLDINAQGTYVVNNFVNGGAVAAAAAFDPTRPVMFPSDSYKIPFQYGRGYFMFLSPNSGLPINVAPKNPVDMVMTPIDKSKVYRSIGSAKLDYKIHGFEDLVATVNVGYDVASSKGNRYTPDGATITWGGDGQGSTGTYDQTKVNTLLDAYLTYNSSWESMSKLSIMAGYSWQRSFNMGHSYSSNNYYEEGNKNPEKILENKRYATENLLVSYFGRVNYTLNNKYILTGTLRYDGSSRFAPDNRWGLFPSAAFAWKISDENFLKNSNTISDLKLRLGYGVTGQQDIVGNNYPYMPQYTYSQPQYDYWMGNGFVQTLRPDGYDPNIKWETTETYNIGLDYGFAQDRIWGSIDLYYRKTNDLINSIPVPAGTNLTNEITTNIGNLENRGIEFSINALAIDKEDVKWEINLNATLSDTKITKLLASEDPNYRGVEVGGISGGTGNKVQVHSVGYSPYTFLLYEQVYNKAGRPLEGVYVDQNGDGVINDEDRVRRGSNQAPLYLGFSTRFTYKNWDLGLNAHANVGNYVYNNRASDGEAINGMYISTGYWSNVMQSARNSLFRTAQYQSDYYLENASFLRLDNITLAYTFKEIFKSKIDARVSFVVNNVAVWTKYSGLDPECFGIDNSAYPRPRTYMMALNLKF